MIDLIKNDTGEDMQAAPKLQLIEGGKTPTDNWLQDLEEGTVFLCIPVDQMVLDAAEWHIELHAGDYTKLHSNLNNPMSMWVNSLRFSRQMKLAMVLGSNAK